MLQFYSEFTYEIKDVNNQLVWGLDNTDLVCIYLYVGHISLQRHFEKHVELKIFNNQAWRLDLKTWSKETFWLA